MKSNEPRQLRVLIALLRFPVMIFLQTARDIVAAMTGNAHYTTPFPALVDVTTALDDLQAKIEAAAGRDLRAIAARNSDPNQRSRPTPASFYASVWNARRLLGADRGRLGWSFH